MVSFNKEEHTFTIIFRGNTEDYMSYLRALARLIAIHKPDLSCPDDIYYAASLLDALLPEENQHVKIE